MKFKKIDKVLDLKLSWLKILSTILTSGPKGIV